MNNDIKEINIKSLYKDSQRGSILLTTILVSVILGSLVFGLVVLLQNSLKSQVGRKESVQFNILLRTLKTQIANPQICSTLFLADQVVGGNVSKISLAKLKIGDNQNFQIGNMVFDNFKLTNLELIRNSPTPEYNYTIQVDAAEPIRRTYSGHIQVTVETPNGKVISNTPAMRAIFEQIPIYYNVAGGRIKSCYGPQSAAHYCEQLGGAWNEKEPNALLRCNPNVRCYTKNLLDPSSCKAPYKSTQIGFASSPIFLCQWCNSFRKN